MMFHWMQSIAHPHRPCQAAPVVLKPMGLVRVDGDGDCLFHALALHDNEDGAALRIDVANFMAAHAAEQEGFQEEWLEEVKKLRAYEWGGATVIGAYSLMKHTRVLVHTWRGEGETVKVEEMSHGAVYGNGDLRAIHVFYNNKDHYDALLEIVHFKDLEPAFPQPPPPRYFAAQARQGQESQFPALPANPQQHGDTGAARKNGMAAPRPPKNGKAKGKAKGTAKAKAKAKAKAQPSPEPKPEEGVAEEVAAEEDSKPGLMEELQGIPVAETSQHPHRRAEDLIKDRECQSLSYSFSFGDGSTRTHNLFPLAGPPPGNLSCLYALPSPQCLAGLGCHEAAREPHGPAHRRACCC